LLENRRFTRGLAESMIASQLPLAAKVERADFVVWNDGSREALETQARLIALHLLS
jgi:dephospho-CoA kinase